MTRSSQKQDERDIIDVYLKARGLTGIVCDGPDPPDFLMTINGSAIGVEIIEHQSEFVAGTKDRIFMLELNATNQMTDSKILAKHDAAVRWCQSLTQNES